VKQNRLSQEELYKAWSEFISLGEVKNGSVRAEILESWKRCRKMGINPFQKKAPLVLTQKELEERRKRKEELISVSLPIMQNLNSFVTGSGFIVILADEDGVIIEISGNKDVAEAVQRGNFIPGADWSEKGAGTNAVGTALILDQPVQVFSYEHYCISSHKWTCSAAPIHDTNGRIIGVLNMSGSYEKVHLHTLGMVVAAVNAIENLLKVQHELRYRTTIMESISDGLVAIDCNMNIKQFNQAAAKLLKSSNLKNKQVEEIFGKRNLALFVNALKGRKITDQEIDIPTKAGKVCCTATVRSIVGKDGRSNGIVLILNEFARTRRLVNRMFGAQAKFTFDDIIGKNEKLVKAINIARTAAGSNSNILLLGESGTGKDVFAQAIHNESNRARGPFVAINCAAIPRELISSELFGYVEGAFTGAKRGGNPGKFELADGGTLFLDEIGEMPLDLQTMLLRVLEQRFVVRIGGQEVIPVDVRIIAATNRDLLAEVEKGNFRKDLYYRLNVVNINLIPLRERKDDIPILVEYFLKRLEQTLGKHFTHIQPEVWKVFQAYHWPGNIRELQNVLERAANIATGDVLSVEHLPPELIEKNINSNKESHLPLEQYEKKIIINLLKEYKGNISKAAARLGIARSTLYRKINKFGIDRNVYC